MKIKALKVLILTALITLSFSLNAAANADSKRAAIEELLVLTNTDRIYEQSFTQIRSTVMQQMKQLGVSQVQSPVLDKYFNKMFELMKQEMSWDKMKNDFIQLYMKVYTEQEIRDIIAFYKSPTGQKMLEKMPLLMQESMAISQKYLQAMMPEIQKIMQQLLIEITSQS